MIKILILTIKTENTRILQVEYEFRQITETIRLSKSRNRYQVRQEIASNPRELRRILLNHKPNVVHFTTSSSIELELDDVPLYRISSKALSSLFRLFSNDIQCILLNTTYSQEKAREISKHIPYVILFHRMSDFASMEFSLGFYDALAAGMSYEQAFEFGLNAIYLQGEESVPVLFTSKNQEKTSQRQPSTDKGYIIREFLSELDAEFENREGKEFFFISKIEGRLLSFLPITVFVSENVSEETVLKTLSYTKRQGEISGESINILVYEKKPDTIFHMKVTELRLKKELIIIPIPLAAIKKALINKSSHALLAEYTEKYLPGADLFDNKNAIGDTLAFFGRNTLLYALEESLKNYQNSGLFGMRKSGKTSIFLQLGYSLQDYPVIHVDLQLYGGQYTYTVNIFNEIISKLYRLATISKLSANTIPKLDTLLLSDAPDTKVATLFVERVVKLSNILREKAFKLPIILFLDEVERIFPFTSDSKEKVEEFNTFFGTLRVLSQKKQVLSLLIADVHPDCTRRNHWVQKDVPTNPVYNFFSEIFIPPFKPEDTYSMLSNIGDLMARTFDNTTQDSIHKQSGGQPFIARQLASMLCKKIPAKQGEIQYQNAKRYLENPFIYSSSLKSYFEQNIWADLHKHKNVIAMKILKLLASNEKCKKGVNLSELTQKLGDYNENECLDALLSMESFSFIKHSESEGENYYSIKILLLSNWIKRKMKPSEIKSWEIS